MIVYLANDQNDFKKRYCKGPIVYELAYKHQSKMFKFFLRKVQKSELRYIIYTLKKENKSHGYFCSSIRTTDDGNYANRKRKCGEPKKKKRS